MSRLKLGVVGVGALGRHHARILSELPTAELIAVADPHPTRGAEIAAKHGTRWVPDYRDLIGLVDAVSIVVPTALHQPIASEFLSRGIPVLVEKPISDSVASAEAMVALADDHHTVLQVGHIERFNPAWQAAAPHVGDPRYLRAERLAPFSFRSTDVGVVLDLMIHDIDLVLSLVDSPIASVEAFGIGLMGPHEDAAQARLRFANGCIADLSASRVHPTASRAVQVWSFSGCTSIDLHQRTVSKWSPSASLEFGERPVTLAAQPGADIEALKARVFSEWLAPQSIPVAGGDALTAELQSFIHCVTTGQRPAVDGAQAVRAMQAAQQVLEQVRSHAWNGQTPHVAGDALLIGPWARPSQPLRKAG
jgi:predicted dehydrogenase